MGELDPSNELAETHGVRDPAVDHDPEGDARWRAVLTGNYESNQRLRGLRPLFRRLPSEPRCRVCSAPYGPPFGPLVRRLGFGAWDKNPSLCSTCLRVMERHLGGADVDLTLLFADLRGSTELAERMAPAAYRDLVNAYYAIAARDIRNCGGVINKYLGDGVFALFVPGFAGPDHAQRGIDSARQMLRDTEAAPELPAEARPLELGIGVHTGTAYVGVMGTAGDLLDFTAIGEAVNLTQRLSSVAAGRELLISDDAQLASGREAVGLARREVHLKGIGRPIVAWSERNDARAAG